MVKEPTVRMAREKDLDFVAVLLREKLLAVDALAPRSRRSPCPGSAWNLCRCAFTGCRPAPETSLRPTSAGRPYLAACGRFNRVYQVLGRVTRAWRRLRTREPLTFTSVTSPVALRVNWRVIPPTSVSKWSAPVGSR